MIIPKLIDNSSESNCLYHLFKNLLINIDINEISIASGYWDLPVIDLLYSELEVYFKRGGKLRLILGIEATVRPYQNKVPPILDPDFPQKYIKESLADLELTDKYQKALTLFTDYMDDENPQIEVKVFKENFLHAKCYIFGSENDSTHVGVVGSSNFTKNGLSKNLELNYTEQETSKINYIPKLGQEKTHRSWFEDIWEKSDEWTKEFLVEVLNVSKHGSLLYSPYETYISALYSIYSEQLEAEKGTKYDIEELDDKQNSPQLLEFQLKNVKSLLYKLDTYGVALLSDSVGLGKTFTAIGVIKHYKSKLKRNVLVLCPANLKKQWETELAKFGLGFDIKILSYDNSAEINSLTNDAFIKTLNIDLFVLDESHNLRSGGGRRYESIIELIKSRKGSRSLLLTATPINNQLNDLKHQISLGTGGESSGLGYEIDSKGNSLTFHEQISRIDKKIKVKRTTQDIITREEFELIREEIMPILTKVMVRRTRSGIEKEYPEGLSINGEFKKFPKLKTENLNYKMKTNYNEELINLSINNSQLKLNKMYNFELNSLATINILKHPLDQINSGNYKQKLSNTETPFSIIYSGILSLGFAPYRYNIYQHQFYGKTLEEIKEFKLNSEENRSLQSQIGIYGIFRTIYLKRLESSYHALSKSLNNYLINLEKFEAKLINENLILKIKDIKYLEKLGFEDLESYYDSDVSLDDETDFNPIPADTKIFKIDQLKLDLIKDKQIIKILISQVEIMKAHDDKVNELIKTLKTDYKDEKVLIFTYFKDTLEYLQDKIIQDITSGQVLGFALGTNVDDYANLFSPKSKNYNLKSNEKEIQYLFATDKLAEGQNLQDARVIINYDLHWNPVRMIQRNGRINRLGTKHNSIFVYNFRPQDELEDYLKLIKNLENKIDIIRFTLGSDQTILGEEAIPLDFIDGVYSDDAKVRAETYDKINNNYEGVTLEDEFFNDLKEFELNSDIEAINNIKTLPIPIFGQSNSDGNFKKQEYLVHINDINKNAGYYVKIDNSKSPEITITTPTKIEALKLLKTKPTDNNRIKANNSHRPAIITQANEYITKINQSESTQIAPKTYDKNQKNIIELIKDYIIENQNSNIDQFNNTLLFTTNEDNYKQFKTKLKNLNQIYNTRGILTQSEMLEFINYVLNHRVVNLDKIIYNKILQIIE